jgi:5,6-dimethylbenzimidazole synthase
VHEFAEKPDLEKAGWLPRMSLDEVIYFEEWGRSMVDSWKEFCNSVREIRDQGPKENRRSG